jgi:acyl carrier protein
MEQFKRLVGHAFVSGVGQLSPDEAGASTPDVEQALLQLPLEGILEPSSALKVAIALGEEFGVDASGARPEDLRTFESIIALVERLRSGAPADEPPAARAPAREQAPVARQPRAAAQEQDPEALEEEVRAVLLENVVSKTGYPEDMLDLELDLEADLGIDTVKQVDIFARTREYFGVPRDPKRSLRDFNTLRKVIDHIVERVLSMSATERAAAAVHSAATSLPPAHVEPKDTGKGGPRSVREALLAMDLRRAGVKNEEVRKLGEATASLLGTAAPDTTKVRTLGELVQHLGKDR